MTLKKATAVLLSLLIAGLTGSLLADDDTGKKGKEGKHDHDRMEARHEDRADEDRDDDDRDRVPSNRIVIINNDVNRLETILNTTQGTTVIVPQATLVRIGNESFVLANRIASNVGVVFPRRNPDAVALARTLRTRVKQMRAAAARGDLAAVRSNAREALQFALRLDGMV